MQFNCPLCGKLNYLFDLDKYYKYDCSNCSLGSAIYRDEFIITYDVNYKFAIAHSYNSVDKQYLNQIDCYHSGRMLMDDFKSSSIQFPFTEEYIKALLVFS